MARRGAAQAVCRAAVRAAFAVVRVRRGMRRFVRPAPANDPSGRRILADLRHRLAAATAMAGSSCGQSLLAPGPVPSLPFGARFAALAGTISGTILGQSTLRKSRSRLYLAFSRG